MPPRLLIAFALLTCAAALGIGLLAHSPKLPPAPAADSAPAPDPIPSFADSFDDGTPDFLRLDSPSDRSAFRRWFIFLAETAFARNPSDLPPEINDCAALVRFCYRESLRKHDGTWAAQLNIKPVISLPSVAKYAYPSTPAEANLFRILPGPFTPKDLHSGAFAQFADAQTLLRLNTYRVSQDLARAQPADLLFFHQLEQDQPFHVMIVSGTHLIYHTGAKPGEIRRPSYAELLSHREPRWRPLRGNPHFLGVFRWNILRS